MRAPTVDVNLFAFNSVETVSAAIDSVLRQTWPAVSLTLIDDGSNDGTAELLTEYATQDKRITLKRNRSNGGAISAFQRAFWHGNADFVMPKSADDIIAPDFIARTMRVLLNEPACVMCHGAGIVFSGAGQVRGAYPPEHRLSAIGGDLVARARHVMEHYTSSPSFWGVYRRTAVDRLPPIQYCAGWDHVLLAELALAGEIRHDPDAIYWRRDGGKPILQLARAATMQARAGLPSDDILGDPRWRTPLITTAFAHINAFATASLRLVDRRALIGEVVPVFRKRWAPAMHHEAMMLRAAWPELIARVEAADLVEGRLMASGLAAVVHASEALVPEVDMAEMRIELAAFASPTTPAE